jgi:thioester reductase-like protein
VLLEVGPGRGLSQLARRHPRWAAGHVAIGSLPENLADQREIHTALGQLWAAGIEPSWPALHNGDRRRVVPLPTYPFERARHWIDPLPVHAGPGLAPAVATLHARPETSTEYVAAATELDGLVVEVFEALLGVSGIGVFDDFFELGGHSLLGTELVTRIRDALGVELPLGEVFERPTPADIASLAERSVQSELIGNGPEMKAANDIWLDEDIRPAGMVAHRDNPAAVLLTGATGYVGSFLLRELLDTTGTSVRCLVRCAAPADGIERIRAGLARYDLLDGADLSRVDVVPGDLSLPRFGLAADEFQALASGVEVIYHNAAKVSVVDTYGRLRAPNVEATRDILRLACTGEAKPVHFVSSIGAFDCAAFRDWLEVTEDDDLSGAGEFHGGYEESKWVAERIIGLARSRGLPVNVYRGGNISGHSQTGAVSDAHLVSTVLRGCVALGVAPDSDAYVDVVPVDYVTRALVALSRSDRARGGTFHLVNPTPVRWREIAERLIAHGYPLRLVSLAQWREAIRTDTRPENVLRAILPTLDQRGSAFFSGRLYRCDHTMELLKDSGIGCPPLDDTLIATYLDHLVSTGQLPGVR